jgi:hypothetical protein
MLDMKSRNQLLEQLIRKYGGYHLKSKRAKSVLLNEYCRLTTQNRKYVIRKLRSGSWVYQEYRKKQKKRRIRRVFYDNNVKMTLIKCWNIFDQSCGQRLASSLRETLDTLIKCHELTASSETVIKLKKISPRTIDYLLRSHKEKEKQKRSYCYKNNPLLYQKIATKLSTDWDRLKIGNIQIDFVEHCGASAYGDFIYTLSTTDIATGWWEGTAQLSRGKDLTVSSIKSVQERYPFSWNSIHTDNDSSFINWLLNDYTQKQKLNFTRSRPYHKNDNCFVEQKNSTHIRKCVGHLRYDTREELKILNNLYSNELRLYKNFFQPIIKLISKERIGGHIKRKYDKPKTPYQRVIDNSKIANETKQKLIRQYQGLNPAELKRIIDKNLKLLKITYDHKHQTAKVENQQQFNPNTVTFLNCTTVPVSVT